MFVLYFENVNTVVDDDEEMLYSENVNTFVDDYEEMFYKLICFE